MANKTWTSLFPAQWCSLVITYIYRMIPGTISGWRLSQSE